MELINLKNNLTTTGVIVVVSNLFYLFVLRLFFVTVLVPRRLLRITVPRIVCCSLAASPVTGRDESDNANAHKSILGTSIDESSRSSALGP